MLAAVLVDAPGLTIAEALPATLPLPTRPPPSRSAALSPATRRVSINARIAARTSFPPVEAAIGSSDERDATALAIAASATGRVPGAALLRRGLPLVEDVGVAVALVRVCPDDAIPMLIDLSASEELSHERESALLWAAVRKLEGHPAPRDLVSRPRLHARRRLGPEAATVLVLAARAVGDRRRRRGRQATRTGAFASRRR